MEISADSADFRDVIAWFNRARLYILAGICGGGLLGLYFSTYKYPPTYTTSVPVRVQVFDLLTTEADVAAYFSATTALPATAAGIYKALQSSSDSDARHSPQLVYMDEQTFVREQISPGSRPPMVRLVSNNAAWEIQIRLPRFDQAGTLSLAITQAAIDTVLEAASAGAKHGDSPTREMGPLNHPELLNLYRQRASAMLPDQLGLYQIESQIAQRLGNAEASAVPLGKGRALRLLAALALRDKISKEEKESVSSKIIELESRIDLAAAAFDESISAMHRKVTTELHARVNPMTRAKLAIDHELFKSNLATGTAQRDSSRRMYLVITGAFVGMLAGGLAFAYLDFMRQGPRPSA